MRIISAAFFAAVVPGGLLAHDYAVGDLMIMHPVAYETPARAMAGAGYLAITNNGDQADTLLAVEASFPRVMVHDTAITDGVASMVHVETLEIAPGETVTFAPGGLHVMFMGLDGDPFEVGEVVPATLVFEQAGSIDVEFQVEARPDPDESSGSTHNH